MATIREGKKSVLLIVDVQVGVMRNAWESARIIQNIRRVVETARSQDVPVIWVQHDDEELLLNSPDWQIVPELSPDENEFHIHKNFNSSFERTPLDEMLAQLEVAHIVLAGAATNWCIRATAYAALDRGYDLTLIADGHSTESMDFEDGTHIEAADIIRELNTAMTWLSYPGRTNTAVPAGEVDFPKPGRAI